MKQSVIESPLTTPSQQRNLIVCSPAIDQLQSLPREIADIIFLDPPFNLGKDYGEGPRADRVPDNKYVDWLEQVILESARVLSPGGALYLYHLPQIASQVTALLNNTLTFRHWIAVSMKNTFARGSRLYPAHYALLYYTKDEPKSFNRPKLTPQRCRHCNGYIKDYGGYRSIIEEKGVNLSDVWDDLSPVRHSSNKNRVANELPITLLERVIEISGFQGALYVDPFAGSGTGALAAVNAGLDYIASDISEEFCSLIRSRLDKKERNHKSE